MTFILCNQVRLEIALKGDKSSTTDNCTLRVTSPTWIDSTISPRDVVEAPLNPNSIRFGFSRLEGINPICLTTNTCKRFVKLPGSTRICLTSKSPISSVRMRASWYGYNTQGGSIGGKRITPSIGWALPLASLGWMELICSRTVVDHSSLCLFLLELYSSSNGPSWM